MANMKFSSPLVIAAGLLVGLSLSGCSKDADVTGTDPKILTIVYPHDKTIFPPDIAAPTLRWNEPSRNVSRWRINLSFADQKEPMVFTVGENTWRPAPEAWAEFKRRSVGRPATLSISGLDQKGRVDSSASISIETSTHPVGDAIFYRDVPLPFIVAVQDPAQIRWRFGSVDMEEQPPVVLGNLPVCGNCHSFSGDGRILGLDVDYGNDKGGYAILPVSEEMLLNDEKIITWSDYRKDDGELTFGLLSQVSPDGRYVISTVKDRAVFVATPGVEYSQLFFPIKGILVVYDRETKTYAPLPGADDPVYVQSNPTWSPDGEHIVFARAKAYDKPSIADANAILLNEKDVPEFIEDNEPFKYDLYRVPFNGGRGGVAEPIAGASQNGKSNFFAEYSPDGKWIVFTQAENYMLLMPDSELFIIPAEGGEARRLSANTPNMNSWHSFSSNGNWLVFSSKANTPYTQLFLTHIDDAGNSSPPVVLDRFTDSDRAANIPEFVPLAATSIAMIEEKFLDAYSFLRAGMASERTGNYAAAVESYDRGLQSEPDNVELLNAKGFALFQQGNSAAALDVLENAVAIDPAHWKAHNNLALAAVDRGEYELAEAHFRESLAIEAQPAIYNDLGFVLERQGLTFEAIDMYRKSLELAPGLATANFNLGSAYAREGDFAIAEAHFLAALASEPTAAAHTALGIALWEQNRREDAVSHLQAAVRLDPNNTKAYDQLGKMLLELGRTDEGREALARAKQLRNALE
jgi:Flp pilus assembly protein TadD